MNDNKNNILVKVDQNNLIYIDPNSIVVNNEVKQRNIPQEELVMYVNLEADLIPRTTMILGDKENKLTSIAKGTFNMLHNSNGGNLNTDWTESYTPSTTDNKEKFTDSSGQSFGIDNVAIKILGTNFIPNVTIKFIDVRGKTLFDSPSDSPYKAFFHLPWPIFYLTIKGYYGKAIRYRLHLVKFSTSYNSENGNFEIDTTFIGSTNAYLNDIPLKGILNAPYMFATENDTNSQFNKKTGMFTKSLKKSSRGYQILTSVYNEYKNKGLISKNFPIKTLRELSITAGRLDKILEKEIFSKVVDPLVLSSLSEYEKNIQGLEESVNSWKSKNLSNEFLVDSDGVQWNKLAGKNNDFKTITGSSGTLEFLLKTWTDSLYTNSVFGKTPIKVKDSFKNSEVNKYLTTISLSNIIDIKKFCKIIDGTVVVDMIGKLGILENIYDIQRIFIEKRKKIEDVIEKEMNNIVSGKAGDNNNSFGFDPTIRNIVAVILANADTYIRLLKEVHEKAFDAGENRKKYINNFDTDSKKNENIYPWPEIKKQTSSGKIDVLVYPGSYDVVNKLKSFNSLLWPEIDFVENFLQVSTYKNDPLTDKEINPNNIEYIFESNSDYDINDISVSSELVNYIPYTDKSFSSLIYEIYERAKYSMSVIPYDEKSVMKLADIEFDNIVKSLSNDTDIFGLIKSNITERIFTGTTANDSMICNLFSNMMSTSIYDRYPYHQNQLPTIDYIKNMTEIDFSISVDERNTTGDTITSNKNVKKIGQNPVDYGVVNDFLTNYDEKIENYRTSIYPFSSPLYLTYLNKLNFTKKDLKVYDSLLTAKIDSFLTSNIETNMWVKEGFSENLFKNNLYIDDENQVNILNTPYFHKQLFDDFRKNNTNGKYVGSAYLLLNSLPFLDLDDRINNKTLVSTLFREISASHKVPYHLMIKWGSIYHRYKTYLNGGGDIISGVTNPINIGLFYDNNLNRVFSGNTLSVDITKKDTVGFYPFYQDVFYQIVNGNTFYDYSSGSTKDFSDKILTGGTKFNMSNSSSFSKIKTYTSFIDNSIQDQKNNTFTLLPSNGEKVVSGLTYNIEIQNSFRVLWNCEDEINNSLISYSGYTFPKYNEYHKGKTLNRYSLYEDYKKIIDLISTFKPEILDVFEEAFIEFSSEKLNTEMKYNMFDVEYNNFQDLLKDIVTINKSSNESILIKDKINELINIQNSNLYKISKLILSNNNKVNVTLGNPREINDYIVGSFNGVSEIITDFSGYYSGQMTQEMKSLIKLYIGDYPGNVGVSSTNYYESFFLDNDILLTEENIKLFRPLIYLYAGFKNNNNTESFIEYLKNNVNPVENINILDKNNKSFVFKKIEKRTKLFLTHLLNKINKYKIENDSGSLSIQRSYNDDIVKLELYNFFKSFNDKWIAGNSIGQRTLMEEFLFLDKANKDIGDQVYIDMTKIVPILDMKNRELNLYSVLVLLLENTGFDIRALPAYVNFYGTNYSKNPKIKPSKDVARNIFGTFLDVDCEESSPKIILQYFGPSSKHLEMNDVDIKSKFKGDGFDISNPNNNPVVVSPDIFRETDFSKSNRAVAFEVSIGDQNQSMFKTIDLDQTTIKNTTESFDVIERLGQASAGSSTAQIDIGLFDIYRQASYSCSVNSMGNVMIQPTMFFYLKNIPMFRGTYWIYEVTHIIKTSGINTMFKGSRIPVSSLPDPKDSFMASYRELFDRMVRKSLAKVNTTSVDSFSTEKPLSTETGDYVYDMSDKVVVGEKIVESAGIQEYGISYNGYNDEKFIQLVNYTDSHNSENNGQWLRAIVLKMGGNKYQLDDSIVMSIISKLDNHNVVTWGNIKNSGANYYSSKFNVKSDFLINNFSKTTFLNPKNNKKIVVNTNIDTYSGPVNSGPSINGYGIGISPALMTSLGLKDGDVLYFKLEN